MDAARLPPATHPHPRIGGRVGDNARAAGRAGGIGCIQPLSEAMGRVGGAAVWAN